MKVGINYKLGLCKCCPPLHVSSGRITMGVSMADGPKHT